MTSVHSANYRYQVGGSLPPEAPSYVQRQSDKALYQALNQGELSYVLSPRQMGKSSLRVRTMQRLQQDGVCCGVLDMTMIGTRAVTLTQWYASIVRHLIRTFDLPISFREWWAIRRELSPVQCLSELLEHELLRVIQSPIVLFIDEIDAILQLDFSADDFFALIRAFHNNRAENVAYRRLTFALIGVATPGKLIENPQVTPFNIGTSIVLEGFKQSEAGPLLQGLQDIFPDPNAALATILAWSHGQPFLTQKICLMLSAKKDKKRRYQADKAQIPTDLEPEQQGVAEHCQYPDIKTLIEANIIDNWEAQDQPEHLKTIRAYLLQDPLISGQLLSLYQRLLNNERIKTNGSPVQVVLQLSGVVVDFQGELTIANPIYRAVFDHHWVTEQLQSLRPYAVAIAKWTASEGKDQAHLLKGWALKQALAWAGNKYLSDLDYRFLAASQEATQQALEKDLIQETEERERAEFALAVATEATQLLAHTKQQAKAQMLSMRNTGKGLIGVMIGVMSLVGLVRVSGSLQRLEWNLFDQFFRWRPLTEVDSRVVMITIDEPDIQTIGFPISDEVLAQAINRVSQRQPKLIGLDIYRDRPIEPGHEALSKLFRQTPNLVGIEKAVQPLIAPPAELADADRVGFADQLLDSDGKLRRVLLSIEDNDGNTKLSFPSKIVSMYLSEAGIEPQPVPNNPSWTQLGRQIIRPFQSNDGGYVGADAGGYQILLNYTGTRQQFTTFSLSQLLANQIPETALRDRIVLIGSTASTVNGTFITPYTNQLKGEMSGVSVHANVISSLLGAALEGRPLMRVWPKSGEIVWIFLWTAAGTLIVGRWRYRPQISSILTGIAMVALVSSAYGLFLFGCWVPMVPAALGIVLASVCVPITTSRQMERQLLEAVTHQLVKQTRLNPAVGQVAIAYFKQSESPKNQRWIDTVLAKANQ